MANTCSLHFMISSSGLYSQLSMVMLVVMLVVVVSGSDGWKQLTLLQPTADQVNPGPR